MNQLDQLPVGAVARARPWDVIGAGLAAPMVLWGFLGWFGIVGDAGGGVPGFYSGTGAAGIGLVLAATALTLNLMLSGRAHERTSPPAAVFLAGAAVIVILGGMVAKPDSATIQAGSVAGLLTAASQAVVLVRGWVQGSQKSVKAANLRAQNARQAAADQAAAAGYGAPIPGYPGPGGYPPGGYGWPAPSSPGGGYPPPGASYQPPVPRYPQFASPTYPSGRPAGYPTAPAGYPSAPAGYPTAPGGFPTTRAGYPTMPGGYPSAPSGNQGGWPGSPGSEYPPDQPGHHRRPPPNAGRPDGQPPA